MTRMLYRTVKDTPAIQFQHLQDCKVLNSGYKIHLTFIEYEAGKQKTSTGAQKIRLRPTFCTNIMSTMKTTKYPIIPLP